MRPTKQGRDAYIGYIDIIEKFTMNVKSLQGKDFETKTRLYVSKSAWDKEDIILDLKKSLRTIKIQ